MDEPEAGPSHTNGAAPAAAPDPALTRLGENVLFRLSNGSLRCVKLPEKEETVHFGKLGSLPSSRLVGLSFGTTYEIEGDTLVPATVELLVSPEETEEANNQHIAFYGVQSLTPDDIAKLREEGITGREMVVKQMSSNSSFDQKTSYSKQKYIAKKEAKYLKLLTPLPSTLPNLCDYWYTKSMSSFPLVHALRVDVLAQILSSANIRPGSRVLLVDDTTSHLLTGAILSRMDGQGRVILVHDADSDPPLLALPSFNLTDEEMSPLRWLNWSSVQATWNPSSLPTATEETVYRSVREKARIEKRTANARLIDQTRLELQEGPFDALIIATAYDAVSVVDQLMPHLSGSGQLVATSSISQPLTALSANLKESRDWLAVTLTEPFLRRYQVLPGRTHPDMNGMQHGGFLLHAIRVLPVDVELERPKRGKNKPNGAKRKRDDAETNAS